MAKFVGARYRPAGLAIRKQAVFDGGGAPALYVRGDEYEVFRTAVPRQMAARAVRLWPGSKPGTLDEYFTVVMHNKSDWMHEREWRLPAPNPSPWYWKFSEDDVVFIILGDEYTAQFANWAHSYGNSWIRSLPIATWNSFTRTIDYTGTEWP